MIKIKSHFTMLKNAILVLFISTTLFSCQERNSNDNQINISPPIAKKLPKELKQHGDTRIDNYFWLNERENPEVIAYLVAENEYTKSMLKETEELQEKLFNEIVGRIKKDDTSAPYLKDGYYYYDRYEKDGEYPIYCRKKGNLDAEEEIILNVNKMAKGHAYYQVGGLNVSPDGKLLAFGVDTVSRRKYTIYVKNLETGNISDDNVPLTTGRTVWASDNKTFFYTTKDQQTLRSNKIHKHILGNNPENDPVVFEETDETFSCGVSISKSNKYIFIVSGSTLTTEVRFAPADNPQEFKVFQPRERSLEYNVEHAGNSFFVITNLDAQNFRLMETPENKTEKENWKELIPHREDVLLEDFEVFKDFLVLNERKRGLNELRIINRSSNEEHYLDFGEETYAPAIGINYDFDTKLMRYSYTSMTTPSSVYNYNMETREKELLKESEVVGDFDKNNYQAKRLWAKADDGTEIPISLVYKKGFEKNGQAPLLLYAYGSYGYSMDPYFSSIRLSLLDRGFVYAIAHIRGGQELGRQWYEDGKLLKKMNTFTDFNDCAEFLIAENYTNPDKLFAMGGSAGGLLMGAIINMQPELYKGVIAAVPFVDVVTTMLDESIPLTTGEFDEWGNPKEKEYYDYMLSYSPYDQVKPQNYPNMLVTTGLHDSQVQYWEPAKWVAKLRDQKTDNNILLLHTNMEAGHGGASGRFKRHRETALEYAFLLDLAEIKN